MLDLSQPDSHPYLAVRGVYSPRVFPRGGAIFPTARTIVGTKQVGYKDTTSFGLCVLPFGGTVAQDLLRRSDASVLDPNWSSDGQRIVFSLRFPANLSRSEIEAICTINGDGTNFRMLTDTSTVHGEYPVWSPDGTQIAFLDTRVPTDAWLTVMSADGKNLSHISSASWSYRPSWSPDGHFVTFGTLSHIDYQNVSLWVYDTQLKGSKEVSSSTILIATPVAWSPNGSALFCFSQEGINQTGVFRVTLSATPSFKRLALGQGYASVVCSPDGGHILLFVVSYQANSNVLEIVVMNQDETDVRTLLSIQTPTVAYAVGDYIRWIP